MSKTQELVAQLEKQISFLTQELERARNRSESLWSDIYERCVNEGNDKDNAEFWADSICELLSGWVHSKRASLTQRVVSTGAMPPYTDCLNDLVVSLTPPGSTPPSLPPEFSNLASMPVSGPTIPPAESPPPVTYNGLSADAQIGPAKMQRVNVPKAFTGAVPPPLPPE